MSLAFPSHVISFCLILVFALAGPSSRSVQAEVGSAALIGNMFDKAAPWEDESVLSGIGEPRNGLRSRTDTTGIPDMWTTADAGTSETWLAPAVPNPNNLPAPGQWDNYGHAIARSGEHAIISAYNGRRGSVRSGEVYILEMEDGEWVGRQSIVSPSGDIYDGFGGAVDIEGGYAVVGAEGVSTGLGVGGAYVYKKVELGWELFSKLGGSNFVQDDRLGASVAVVGNQVFLGAPGKDVGTSAGAGSVYVYDLDTCESECVWSESIESGMEGERGFGSLISADDDIMVVTSDISVQMFGRGEGVWDQVATVDVPSWAYSSAELTSIVVKDGVLVIGKHRYDLGGQHVGVAFVYDLDQCGVTCGYISELRPSEVDDYVAFGASVDISEGSVVVGVAGAIVEGENTGAAYFYDLSTCGETCTEDGIWVDASLGPLDGAGHAVSIEEDGVLVSARFASHEVIGTGSVMWYDAAACSGVCDGGKPMSVPTFSSVWTGLGSGVQLWEDWAFVGSGGFDHRDSNDGGVMAFVHKHDSWILKYFMTAIDGRGGDRFGESIAVDGDWLAVGALGARGEGGSRTGAVYLYRLEGEGWVLHQKLSENASSYGSSVAINGDVLVVGADRTYVDFVQVGMSYVYEFDGAEWGLTASLNPASATSDRRFGSAVAVGDGVVAVGASGQSGSTGEVYLFNESESGWEEVGTLQPENLPVGSRFGASLSLDQGRLVVGAPHDDVDGTDTGAAYVFEQSAGLWEQVAVLVPEGLENYDGLGSSVALSGTTVALGAPGVNPGASRPGATFVFQLLDGEWIETETLTASVEGEIGEFGAAVSLTDGRLLVGAPESSLPASLSGAAFIYDLSVETLNESQPSQGVRLGFVSPNPTHQGASVAIELEAPGEVSLRVYDMMGRLVGVSRQMVPAGNRKLSVPVDGLSPGAYVVRVETSDGQATRRVTVLR